MRIAQALATAAAHAAAGLVHDALLWLMPIEDE